MKSWRHFSFSIKSWSTGVYSYYIKIEFTYKMHMKYIVDQI